jgi:hypothetical protein
MVVYIRIYIRIPKMEYNTAIKETMLLWMCKNRSQKQYQMKKKKQQISANYKALPTEWHHLI